MFHKPTCLLLTLCLLGSVSCVWANLFAYEPYDELQEGAPVAAGGTGLLPGPTTVSRQPVGIAEQGLSFHGDGKPLAVRGKAGIAPYGASIIYNLITEGFETLRSPEDSDSFGAPGTAIWFSFLIAIQGEVSPSTEARVVLAKNRMVCGLTGNEKSGDAYIRLSGPRTNIPIESGKTYLVVGKITYGEKNVPDDRTDTVEIWVNPEVGLEEPGRLADAALRDTSASLKDFWFQTNSTSGSFTALFDEVRIGETYVDVTPAAP